MAGRSRQRLLRLEIEPVIAQAEELAARVQRELPAHPGIIRAAEGVASAAREARNVARTLRRPWDLHRLPAAFLALALLLFAWRGRCPIRAWCFGGPKELQVKRRKTTTFHPSVPLR